MKDNILPIIILVVLTLLVGGIILFDINQREIIEQETPTIPLIENNTLIAYVSPNYREPITYGTLLNCLSYYESRHDPEAYNKDDPNGGSFGILQFQKPTFQQYCVEKYKLARSVDEIWDTEIQKRCCDYMLKEGKGYLWMTYKYCIQRY